jgi:hypothetical protein
MKKSVKNRNYTIKFRRIKSRKKIGGALEEISKLKKQFETSKSKLIQEIAHKKASKFKIKDISSFDDISEYPDKTCGGKWVTIGFIAKGAFGEVYLSRHKDSDIWVAIKEIYHKDPPKSRKTQKLEKTLDEINMANNLSTSGVSAFVRDVWRTPKTICFAADVMIGTLEDKTLTRDDMIKICVLLKNISDKNILYTDIRPENIMIDGCDEFKITDWGTNGWELHSHKKNTVKYYPDGIQRVDLVVSGKLAGEYLKSAVKNVIERDEWVSEWLTDNMPINKIAQSLISLNEKERKKIIKAIIDTNENEDFDMESLKLELDSIEKGKIEKDQNSTPQELKIFLLSIMLFNFMCLYFSYYESAPSKEMNEFFICTLSKLNKYSFINIWNYTGNQFKAASSLWDGPELMDETYQLRIDGETPKGVDGWIGDIYKKVLHNFNESDKKYINSKLNK